MIAMKRRAAVLTLLALLGGPALALGQQGARLAPSQTTVIVTAGQASAPVTLRVTEPEVARTVRSHTIMVRLPAEIARQVTAQPAAVSISVAPGQTQGQATLRFVTQPTAPAGSWVVPLATADGSLISRLTLEIRAGRQPTPGAAPAPVGERPRGRLQFSLEPGRLQLCDGGDAARGTIVLRALDGYSGRPVIRFGQTPAGIFASAAMLGVDTDRPDPPTPPPPLPVPPDRRIPFEISARGAAPGSYPFALSATDAARGLEIEARTTVVVRPADFTARAAPPGITVRRGGPAETLAVSIEPNDCFDRRPIRVTASGIPAGLEVTPPSAMLPAPDAGASLRVRATPSVRAGRHELRIELADASAGGRARHELRVPIVVEPPGPAELARAPRVERVEPATLAPGERATLELTGRNLGPEVTFAFDPDDIEVVSAPIFLSPTRARVEVEVHPNTRTGVRTVVTAGSLGRFEGPGLLRIELGPLADRPEEEPEEAPPEEEPEAPPASPGDVAQLDFGGFVVTVTSASEADLVAFTGEGTLEEFVFAGRLQTVGVDFAFEGLSLEATATPGLYDVLSGEAVFDKAVNLSLPAVVTGMGVQLQGMVLRPDEARIDGRVFLPFAGGDGGLAGNLLAGGGDGGAGGAGGATELPGLTVIPALQVEGLMPSSGGGAVLAYGGTPLSGAGAELLVAQFAGEGGGGLAPGGFDLQADPGAPTGSVTFSDQPLGLDGDFIYQGLAQIDSHAMGQSGVSFEAQQGLSVLIDLSKGANQNQPAIDAAYRAWEVPEDDPEGMVLGLDFADANSPPSTPHTSPQWMGLVFLDAELAAGGIGIEHASTDVAWVAAGFQTLLARSFGGTPETVMAHGWEVDLLNALLGIKNSILIDAGAMGDVHLPFFDEPLRVSLHMTNGGTPSMKAVAPVAHHFGHTAVIGEGAAFFWHQGELKLGFNDARWAFNDDLEAPEPPDTGGGIQDVLAANQPGQTDWEFLDANYERQFHLKMLTLRANGDADLYGETKRSLASVPQLDFLDYPFLDGGASILLEQQGASYTLGLEGHLELADNLGGIHATTRYRVQDGHETTWTFEGGVDANVKVVHLDLDVAGEVDLVTEDLFFNATGALTIEEMFGFDAAGAFGRQGSTRYWYVAAALDLQGIPLVETGFVSFYSFKGGVAHNLDLGVSGACGILDPIAFAGNADQCVDGSVDWAFLAGTVLAPSEGYGGDETVHIDGTLMISAQGSVDILGQGWLMRSFAEGYGANAPPQAAVHVGIDGERFVMTGCVGPSGSSQGAPASAQTISCEGLDPARFPKAVPVVEVRGWSGLLLDWTNDTYYLALGHYGNRVEAKFYGLAYRQGYVILAYSPSVPASWLPPLASGQAGFYAGRAAGYDWGFEHSWGLICDNKVWAQAQLGSESNFFLELAPFALYADVAYWIDLGVGAQICGISGSIRVAGDVAASVYVSQQLGELNGSFSGKVVACGKNNCLVLVSIPNINVELTLWEA